MAIREVRVIGEEVLLKPCKKVKEMTPRLEILIEDMIDTMRAENGVGLAAPQVGILKRIMVIEVEENNPVVFINPEIREERGEQVGYEGCLSVPGKSGIVRRPNEIVVEAYDINMEPFTLECEGLFARAVCHECDHLDGKLYVDLVEGELKNTDELADEGEIEV